MIRVRASIEPGVADGEAHAPAGHGVGLGERGELDRHVAGALDLEDRGGRVAVEVDLGVGEVGEHPEVVLLGEGDEIAVEIEVADLRRRVGREGDDERHRLRHRVDHRALQRAEIGLGVEAAVVEGGDVAERAAGDHEAVGVDGVAGVRDEHDVARGGDRHGEVGEALLGAEGGDDLGLGVELHPEAAGVVAGLGAAEAGDALGGGIAVGAGAAHGLHKLFDDVGGRVHVGVAHAEVDDVHALGAVAGLEPVHLGEDVGGQALDAVEFFGHGRTGAAGLRVARYSAAPGRATGAIGGELTFPNGAAQAMDSEEKNPGRRLCEGMHNPCTTHAQCVCLERGRDCSAGFTSIWNSQPNLTVINTQL